MRAAFTAVLTEIDVERRFSCDGPAYKRAKAVVPTFRPDDYARTVLSLDAARDRFFERAEVGVINWVQRNGGATPMNSKAVELLWKIYNAIWVPPGAFTA